MSLNAALNIFLEEYPKAKTQPLQGNSVAEFIRTEIPQAIHQVIGENDRYLVHGSPGKGNWATVPWAAIYDRFITESAQSGFYIVYLVTEDFSGIYISLNQGVTAIRRLYGSQRKYALRTRASDYAARIGKVDADIELGPIDLKASKGSSLSADYQQGSICARYYERGAIPGDVELGNDLQRFMELYVNLATKELAPLGLASAEDDEAGLDTEDATLLREHKRIERNRKLAEKAKKANGYTCQACGFNFEEHYGEIGRRFIEAHHLVPVRNLKGQKVTLDPKNDFSVLCSNCHRMIHRSEFVDEVSEFRAKYVTKGER
ncbi:DUF3578 domain-containing protein [Halomonas sabkhae]|uniref:MrcB family domain-containing protein n=1 Tax=Halomonas sabkhae TaxID=626223 RepID=UPI0025B29F45|nr:DUF3578 domain-containing protein [Halomonas sabkhae]MDN3525977.1 DUF3578 domain-containing protein [Halomonas sabkhae]